SLHHMRDDFVLRQRARGRRGDQQDFSGHMAHVRPSQPRLRIWASHFPRKRQPLRNSNGSTVVEGRGLFHREKRMPRRITLLISLLTVSIERERRDSSWPGDC